MRKLLIPVCLFLCLVGKAQDIDQLGIFTTEELRLTECPFDKDASAVVLLHEARSDFNQQHNLLTIHHVKIKILKERSVDVANVTIPFYRKDEFEYIDEIRGMTMNPLPGGDVEKHEIELNSIYTEKTNENWGQIKFAFPAVRVGSILEFTYRSVMKDYRGLEIKDWEFQDKIPVVKSKYKVIILRDAEFTYEIQKSPEMSIDIKQERDLGSVTFEMDNIPGLDTEPFMDARNDYVQKIKFQLSGYSGRGYKQKFSTTWPELSRSEMQADQIGGQLNKSLPGTEDFIQQAKQLTSDYSKMSAVYDYVRTQMVWNGRHTFFSPDGIKSAWAKKNGTSGDINLILVNLLRAVDLKADPMLVSERSHGKVRVNYPFEDQFNSIYAAVPANNSMYYLDATNKYLPPTIIPYQIVNTTAFILNNRDGQLIPIIGGGQYSQQIVIAGTVNDDGSMAGTARVKSAEYARLPRIEKFKSDQQKFIDEYFRKGADGIIIDSFSVLNENDNALPFIQNVKFTLPATPSSGYQFLHLNLFTGEPQNPFESNNRFSTINFGYTQRVLVTAIIDIPASFAVDALPTATDFATSNNTLHFQRTVSFADGKMVQNSLLEVNLTFFNSNDYTTVRDFYKRVYDLLKEPVVLKKK